MGVLLEKKPKVQSPKHDAVLRLATSHTFLVQTLRVAAPGRSTFTVCSVRQQTAWPCELEVAEPLFSPDTQWLNSLRRFGG